MVKVMLVFNKWTKDGNMVYDGMKRLELSAGSFHAGTCFQADIDLRLDEQKELVEAIKEGFVPTVDVWGVTDEAGVMRTKPKVSK